VSPGDSLTPALKDAIDKRERNISVISNNSAMGLLVKPNEVAKAIAFLASNLG
jgi:NAD(P)-dependent dehydrogenase (short-subunit alcohol dehydrogenase family)